MATFIATGVSRYTDFGLDLSRSEGRFVALQKSFLDPATVPPGTFLTVTGEMAGTIVLPLDETEYTYPLIHITNLRVWSENDEEAPSHPPPHRPRTLLVSLLASLAVLLVGTAILAGSGIQFALYESSRF